MSIEQSNKFLCIHGHFYQPPRENAWLEHIELQESASPFHDWNERINFECYAPNTAARILDKDRIEKIVNNYERISFNFGPTLLSWMEEADPDTYAAIQEADRRSIGRYGGHGNAIAQAHSHLILPLCNERDKRTQIKWGISDFRSRFHRMPEGMWLAETAVDTDSLEILAEEGIRYTILAPRQAKAVRAAGNDHWFAVNEGSIDTKKPYWCNLPSGRRIALFFYDGEVAQAVAFKGLLNNGHGFAHFLKKRFNPSAGSQLVHIATDGESYGHHHRFGEMALASCLEDLDKDSGLRLTNYGEYLDLYPPQYEIQIHDNSSWSCVHGVERWRSNCGCCTGGRPDWNQSWRGPLRKALDWLRDELIPLYEKEGKKLVRDPWLARDQYIDVILDRNEGAREAFLDSHQVKILTEEEQVRLWRLLEMQRNALYMYTSCGWFFDEVSGIETNQILQYALRAQDYAKQVAGVSLHATFESMLEETPSNVHDNALNAYQKFVIPNRVGLDRAGMHLAVNTLFDDEADQEQLFNYDAELKMLDRRRYGNRQLLLGNAVLQSLITRSRKNFRFVVLQIARHNVLGFLSAQISDEELSELKPSLVGEFQRNHLGALIELLQTQFEHTGYTVDHLFRDKRQEILQEFAKTQMEEAEYIMRRVYQDNYQLMSDLKRNQLPLPGSFLNIAHHTINSRLHRYFQQDVLDLVELKQLAHELERWGVGITYAPNFELEASERIFYEVKTIQYNRVGVQDLKMLKSILDILDRMGVELNVWKSQNLYYAMEQERLQGDWSYPNEEWKTAYEALGTTLMIRR